MVQKFINDSNAAINAYKVQIDLLEAQLEVKSQEKHDVINEKLASESRLKKEKEDIVHEREQTPTKALKNER